MDDQIIAYGDKTWIGTTTYRRTEGAGITTVTQVPSGTWNQTGANVTLNYSGGATAHATISGDVITFTAPGVIDLWAGGGKPLESLQCLRAQATISFRRQPPDQSVSRDSFRLSADATT